MPQLPNGWILYILWELAFLIILDLCFMLSDFNWKGTTETFSNWSKSYTKSCNRRNDRFYSPELTHKLADWQWKWWPGATDWDWKHIKVAASPPFQIYPPWIDHEAINGSQSVRVITPAAKWKQNSAVCSKAGELYLKSVVFCVFF